jgi:hypothetical protein
VTFRTENQAETNRCDATHRATVSDTHLTHVCIEDFCGISSALSARSIFPPLENHGFLGLSERAPSAPRARAEVFDGELGQADSPPQSVASANAG